jgi:2-amino-4-hydroxy-6-hydroxymethyldihydropteridine diphosphokinase
VTRAYVALGANLGERAQAIARAVEALRATPGITVAAVSRLWETAPVGPPQPAYLNAAVALDTTLDALALLARLHAIEAEAGRTRGAERNLPRSLDLDLLLFGGLVIEADEIVVPHPRMHERAFVLEPLAEIAAQEVHPTLRETIATLAARVRSAAAAWPAPDSGQPASPSHSTQAP